MTADINERKVRNVAGLLSLQQIALGLPTDPVVMIVDPNPNEHKIKKY